MTNYAPPALELERSVHLVLHLGAAGGAPSGAPPLSRGLGAGAAPDVNQSSRGAQANRGSLLEEEPKIEANQLLTVTKGGVLGTPSKLHTRPWGRGDEAAGSARHEGGDAPPTDPTPGAVGRPGTLKADGGAGEGGGRFLEDATASAEGSLKD